MIHPDAQSDTEPPHGGRIEDRTRNKEGSAYGQARVSKERQGPRPQEVQGHCQEAAGFAREIAPEIAGEPRSGHQTFAHDEAEAGPHCPEAQGQGSERQPFPRSPQAKPAPALAPPHEARGAAPAGVDGSRTVHAART